MSICHLDYKSLHFVDSLNKSIVDVRRSINKQINNKHQTLRAKIRFTKLRDNNDK